ncbi:MAG: T9SS type A sorting domain-containing protein [Saprospiraceae bacterium]
MKTRALHFMIFFVMSHCVLSQSCLPNGLHMSAQSQVDQFAILNPGCKIIEGGVTVTGNNIKNLDGLSDLIEIKGDLIIGGCDSLLTIDGLENVTSIGGAVRVQDNQQLSSIGLKNLAKLPGDYCYISNNPFVTTLEGLGQLDSVWGIFQIWNMDSITNLNGLGNMRYAGNDFAIFRNRNLQNLDGIGKLEHIVEGLRVYENENLTSILSLSSQLKIDGALVVNNNPKLSSCHASAVCRYLGNPPSFIFISNNANGCNNIVEVQAACTTSTGDSDLLARVNVYPNPVFGQQMLRISSPIEISTVRIVNSQNQVVFNPSNKQGKELDITLHLSSGIYFIQLQIEKQTITKKLVVL